MNSQVKQQSLLWRELLQKYDRAVFKQLHVLSNIKETRG